MDSRRDVTRYLSQLRLRRQVRELEAERLDLSSAVFDGDGRMGGPRSRTGEGEMNARRLPSAAYTQITPCLPEWKQGASCSVEGRARVYAADDTLAAVALRFRAESHRVMSMSFGQASLQLKMV